MASRPDQSNAFAALSNAPVLSPPNLLQNRLYFPLKRAIDLGLVITAAPAALLITMFAAIAIWRSYGRPVFFFQERVGRGGRIFRIAKLRTMTGVPSGIVATLPGDSRITPVGARLRQYRIDEIPQLLNVLKGEMSLIGPRPEQPSLCEKYRECLPRFDERILIRPGITGLAQVMYGYAATVEETRIKLRYDRFYVARASFRLDMLIIAKTIATVCGRKGAR